MNICGQRALASTESETLLDHNCICTNIGNLTSYSSQINYHNFINLLFPALPDLVLSAIHTKPDDAVIELSRMVDVYEDLVERWDLKVKKYRKIIDVSLCSSLNSSPFCDLF